MDERARSGALGRLNMNAALILTASWIPALGLLEGASWATPNLAGTAHFFGLGFLLGAPLAFGARLWWRARGTGAAGGEALKDWALRGLLPPVLFGCAIQGVVLMVPHLTVGVIVGLMFAGVALGLYGLMLVREGAAPAEG